VWFLSCVTNCCKEVSLILWDLPVFFFQCLDKVAGNGNCICEAQYKGFACELCQEDDKFGPLCNQSKLFFIKISIVSNDFPALVNWHVVLRALFRLLND